MKRWNLILGLLALFLSGVAIGAAGTAIYFKQTVGHVFSQGQPGIRKFVMKKLVRELDLTEAQKARVESILGDVQDELREFRSQHRREIESILDRGIEQIKPELSPEQQKKLDTLYERLKQHRLKYGDRGAADAVAENRFVAAGKSKGSCPVSLLTCSYAA